MRDGPAPGATGARDLVTSVYLWGSKREEVNRLAARAAKGMDPNFAWVEALDSDGEGEAPNHPKHGIVAPTRAFAPPRGVSGDRIWTYLRQNGQRHSGQELQTFTQMSEPIQRAIEWLLEQEPPRVLVVANLERLREYFCAETPGPHPFIEWLNSHEISLVASSTGGPLREGVHFDYLVTQPEATRNIVRPPIVAICQRGDSDPALLLRIFHPIEVVCLSGLSPSAPASPAAVTRGPTN
jgi:hypothetical protein